MNSNLIHQYIQAGFALVAIPAGQKGPTHAHWNQRSTQSFPLDWAGNLGILHPYCKEPTGALDLDDLEGSRSWMADRGLDLSKYLNAPDAVQIVSGRPGRAKLLYKMPIWSDWMRTRKITDKSKTLFELRSATRAGLAVQDVLPPSIHPDTGQPYTWQGDFTKLLEFPPELIQLWMELNKPRDRGTWAHDEVKDAEVESALMTIDPDLDRDSWVQVGMALHSFDPDAIDLFDKWSSKGSKYIGTDVGPVWDSFDASEDGITIATLFKHARDAGWTGYLIPIERVLGVPGQAMVQPPIQGSPQAHQDTLRTAPPVDISAQLHEELGALPPYQFTDSTLTRKVEDVLLKSIPLSVAEQVGIQEAIRDYTSWTKKQIADVVGQIKRRHRQLIGNTTLDQTLDEYTYIANLHTYYQRKSREFIKPEAFVSLFQHLDSDIKERALSGEGVPKMTGLKFDPGQPEAFAQDGATYLNLWQGLTDYGTPGDHTPWLKHVEALVPAEAERHHLIDWMAFTIQHPGIKINHGCVINGPQGAGKDSMLWPLVQALGRHSKDVPAGALLSDFNDWVMDSKLVIVQEVDLGNHKDAVRVSNQLKSVLAAPPEEIRINRKGIPEFYIRNICSLIMLTNESDPIRITQGDRRYFVIETPLRVTDDNNAPIPGWEQYFESFWQWMEGGGWRYVVNYLMTHDVSRFKPKSPPPMTEAKAEVIKAGYSPLGRMLVHMLEDGVGPMEGEVTTVEAIQQWLVTGKGIAFMSMHGVVIQPSQTQLGREMTQCLGATKGRGRLRNTNRKIRYLVIRNKSEWSSLSPTTIVNYLEERGMIVE